MKRLGRVLGGLLALTLFSLQAFAAAQTGGRDFNHMSTGFPLAGGHAVAACETCHIGGVFKGTPRACDGCHAVGKRILATPKSSAHIVTDAPCENCHFNTATWLGARYNHGSARPGQCLTCHNGRVAQNKPSSHNSGNKATKSCDSCHRSSSWLPASWNHIGVTSGSCATCHNGSTAPGKTSSHTGVKGTLSCDDCHGVISWLPAAYSHRNVVPGSCATCHNGSSATGKPSSHAAPKLKGTAACDDCHVTSAWSPALYKHLSAAACSSCHNGSIAAGKSAGHVATTDECNQCHLSKLTWTGALGGKPANHIPYTSGTCTSCHTGSATKTGAVLHAYVSTVCTTCHLNGGASYLGNMDKKGIGHEGMKSGDDCSMSGCHKPAGSRGTAYINWD